MKTMESMKVGLIKLKDVDMGISMFTGPLKFRETGEKKMCDVCGEVEATWVHTLRKNPEKKVYLCFGCGDH